MYTDTVHQAMTGANLLEKVRREAEVQSAEQSKVRYPSRIDVKIRLNELLWEVLPGRLTLSQAETCACECMEAIDRAIGASKKSEDAEDLGLLLATLTNPSNSMIYTEDKSGVLIDLVAQLHTKYKQRHDEPEIP